MVRVSSRHYSYAHTPNISNLLVFLWLTDLDPEQKWQQACNVRNVWKMSRVCRKPRRRTRVIVAHHEQHLVIVMQRL